MGNSEEKTVYLTFDQGYEAGYTEKILDTLKEKQVSATFFITAHYVNTQDAIIKRMIQEGHILRKPHSKPQKYARTNRRKTKRRNNETPPSNLRKIRSRNEIPKTTKRRI